MLYILYLLAGIFIGVLITFCIMIAILNNMSCGMLKYAYDGEEKYLFLDLDKYPEDILRKKFVIFKVDSKSIGSHD